MPSSLLKITGLWPTKTGNGWSGSCGNTRILILPVDKTKPGLSPKAPDYELLVALIDEGQPITQLPPLAEGQTFADVLALRDRNPKTTTSFQTARSLQAPPEDDPRFNDDIPF